MSNHTLTRPISSMKPINPVKPWPGQSPGYGPHAQQYHGFCPSCRHPIAQCVCHRDCRKIEKELLVQPTAVVGQETPGTTAGIAAKDLPTEAAKTKLFALMDLISPAEVASGDEKAADTDTSLYSINKLRQAVIRQAVPYGIQSTVIGGGCCVHLSIEYMPLSPLLSTPSLSGALVMDSEVNMLAWGKFFTDDGYHVKECIISTNPGAYLWVVSINSVTRVRWCEIISC
jgi:hypothetical protein